MRFDRILVVVATVLLGWAGPALAQTFVFGAEDRDDVEDGVAPVGPRALGRVGPEDVAHAANGRVERMHHIIRQFQRAQFGRRSERLDPDQLQLTLEERENRGGARAGDRREDQTAWWRVLHAAAELSRC